MTSLLEKIYCTRRIEFDAAHRVIGHAHKCKFLHGHRYILEVTLSAMQLNDLGMLIDFGLIKECLKQWIDIYLDHNVILHEEDKVMGELIEKTTGQKIYYLKNNPTAENIALHLKYDIFPLLLKMEDCAFELIKVKLFETPNCYVEV